MGIRSRAALSSLSALIVWTASPSHARPFQLGDVDGLLDVTLSYGVLARVEDRDRDIVGIGNGGTLPTVNGDDGNLNYDTGLAANQFRATAELTLRWRNFGAVVRGFGFYDFENQLEDRERTDLSADALWRVGAGAGLQDAYLAAEFDVAGIPLLFRVGRQVVNWGESSFLRFGVDVTNPVDLVAIFQPTTTANDLFIRQGMVWGAANITETLAIEGFYQWDWEPVGLSPVGWLFSIDDLYGGDGENTAFEGFGQFSDQGTDLDRAFGLPPGTLGFDRNFMRIPSAEDIEPRSQGQFGFTLQAFVPALNATRLALHFVNYHSRLPLISGRTADQAAIDATDDAAVNARAAALSAETGLPVSETRPIAETLTIGDTANRTRYFASYPEDIRMLGLSFSTATLRTGTLLSGEVSHHFGWPVQAPKEEVLAASLSPIQFTDVFAQTSLGAFEANEVVPGFTETGKTQLSLGLAQLLGPRLGATSAAIGFDVGWVHVDDLPSSHPFDKNSWGYRLIGQITYSGVLGGLQVRPRIAFVHDVQGVTPGPGIVFIEDRKALSVGVSFDLTNTWTSNLSYTTTFGAEPVNQLHDRDFVLFNVTFHY